MIDGISYVAAVFVSDQDEACDFYINKLGFEIEKKSEYWVEVTPAPGSETSLALIESEHEELKDRMGAHTGIVCETSDIQQSYETLKERGVRFDWEPVSRPWGGSDAQFVDQDNNKLLLVSASNELTTEARHQKPPL